MTSGLYLQAKHFTYQLERLSPTILKATAGILRGFKLNLAIKFQYASHYYKINFTQLVRDYTQAARTEYVSVL